MKSYPSGTEDATLSTPICKKYVQKLHHHYKYKYFLIMCNFSNVLEKDNKIIR